MDKYQSTWHVSYSQEVHRDDKRLSKALEETLINTKRISFSVKMDGGNSCIADDVFARSHSTPTFCSSFDYIKNVHFNSKKHLLNPKYKYFGENMYAIHSIEYTELPDFFLVFHILDAETNEFLSIEELQEECVRCNFTWAPIIHIELKDGSNKLTEKQLEDMIFAKMKEKFYGIEPEGFVIRNADRFNRDDFSENMAKFVRNGHVQTDEHWSKNWKPAKMVKSNEE